MHRSSWLAGLALMLAALPAFSASWPRCRTRPLADAAPAAAAAVPELANDLKALLREAVDDKVTPAAALLVARRGRVIFRDAVGAARHDSLFDLASLTKVIVTTTAVQQLRDAGKLDLRARAATHLQWLGADKRDITVEQLLMHTAGLHSVVYRGELTDGRSVILDRIRRSRLRARPGARHRYSDLGYILLGELVAAISGSPLDRYAARRIFAPLGMCATGFAPPASVLPKVISPWPGGGKDGQVYDPLAARLGGVAGHAGLYSTIDDVALFAQMLLQGGKLRGARVLSEQATHALHRPRQIPGGGRRGLGWTLDVNRAGRPGTLSARAFGHTGFTGTSLWIDPANELVVVLLTARTFFEPARSVGPLRMRIHSLIRSSLLRPAPRAVRTGLDRLQRANFAPLKGKRLGVITNRTAVDRRGRWVVEALLAAPSVQIGALFVPEHGLDAHLDRHIKDGALATRAGARVPVYSLFGPRRRPADGMLRGLDALLFDVPVVGVRYYTYLATMGWAMEEAARRKLEFIVLDRPNPLGGEVVQGPVALDNKQTSTNYHPLPVRYGMTTGELARLYNAERRIRAKLTIVPVEGWRRAQRFDEQGLPWRDPSPNIRSWRQALLYAGVGLLEGTNLAVGRGTDSPFLWVGAPWIDGRTLARTLNARDIPGVRFVAEAQTPRSSRYSRQRCEGVRLVVYDPDRFPPVRAGIELAVALRALYPQDWQAARLARLIRHPPTFQALLAGKSAQEIMRLWHGGLLRFRKVRRRYLLY